MREIKFRAWDKEKKEMLTWEMGLEIYQDGVRFLDQEARVYHLDCELMQFTGLKDKNGKEIYEGDIVKQIGELGTDLGGDVRYNEKVGAFLVRGCLEFLKNKEVVGNIYENPELLT